MWLARFPTFIQSLLDLVFWIFIKLRFTEKCALLLYHIHAASSWNYEYYFSCYCQEPLRASISNQLRNSFQGLNIASEILEQAVPLVMNDNLDLGCAVIEHAATEKVSCWAALIYSYVCCCLQLLFVEILFYFLLKTATKGRPWRNGKCSPLQPRGCNFKSWKQSLHLWR